MSATDFLPRREADLLSWSSTFRHRLVEDPHDVGITPQQAAEYSDLHEAFAAALFATSTNSMRTPSSIVRKNDAQRALRAAARKLAKQIRARPGITAEQRRQLGLSVRDRGGRSAPIPRPMHAPRIDIISMRGVTARIRLRDATAPARRGRPVGMAGATIFMHIGGKPPADPDAWTLADQTSRTITTITFPGDVAPGTPVWITANWFNPRWQAGPRAAPVCTMVQGMFRGAA